MCSMPIFVTTGEAGQRPEPRTTGTFSPAPASRRQSGPAPLRMLDMAPRRMRVESNDGESYVQRMAAVCACACESRSGLLRGSPARRESAVPGERHLQAEEQT